MGRGQRSLAYGLAWLRAVDGAKKEAREGRQNGRERKRYKIYISFFLYSFQSTLAKAVSCIAAPIT